MPSVLAEEGDEDEPSRSASAYRPLALRNSDTKVIIIAAKRSLAQSAMVLLTPPIAASLEGVSWRSMSSSSIWKPDALRRPCGETQARTLRQLSSTLRLRSPRSRGLTCSSRSCVGRPLPWGCHIPPCRGR